ncbi:MAG TPA: 2-dehydropantoate 2-reductase [Feifaniaceae bacterium]|nr:2-dehydropantoate 2-reductase [Feifaniaceae bacterium]
MQLNIMIVGAGGIGGYLAAKLCAKYDGVTLIARGAQLAAIRARGLTLVDEGESSTVFPLCTDDPAEAGIQDAIFLCTKGYGLEEAVKEVRPCIGPDTLLVPLLNGVNTHKRVRSYAQAGLALDGCIYVFSRITAPGVIEKTGSIIRVLLGVPGVPAREMPASVHALCRMLNVSGINAKVPDDIIKETFIKWSFICSNGQATAYYNVPIGVLREDPKMWAFLVGLLDEALLVAKKEGIDIPEDLKERHLAAVGKLPYEATSSFARDLAEPDKPTELNLFAGEVCRMAEIYGVQAPYNRRVLERFSGRI